MNINAPEQIPVDALLLQLPDIGDHLSSALASFARNPSAPTAEILAHHLHGTSKLVMSIRAGLMARASAQQEATP